MQVPEHLERIALRATETGLLCPVLATASAKTRDARLSWYQFCLETQSPFWFFSYLFSTALQATLWARSSSLYCSSAELNASL
jgi:hypothetical protein